MSRRSERAFGSTCGAVTNIPIALATKSRSSQGPLGAEWKQSLLAFFPTSGPFNHGFETGSTMSSSSTNQIITDTLHVEHYIQLFIVLPKPHNVSRETFYKSFMNLIIM